MGFSLFQFAFGEEAVMWVKTGGIFSIIVITPVSKAAIHTDNAFGFTVKKTNQKVNT
jgi:hypothetical protein